MSHDSGVRLDRWLWAARFFKTRAQAKQAIDGGKVHYDGRRSKPARDVDVGASIEITRGRDELTVIVVALSDRRGRATDAQRLYRETEESAQRRIAEGEQRRLQRAGMTFPANRPGKRDRRLLADLKNRLSPDD